jgi:hypothetical protein
MTPENQMKMALLEEFKKAYRYQNFYYESCEVLGSLLRSAVEFYREQRLEIPNKSEVYRLVEELDEIIGRHSEFKKTILPNASLHDHDQTETGQNLFLGSVDLIGHDSGHGE